METLDNIEFKNVSQLRRKQDEIHHAFLSFLTLLLLDDQDSEKQPFEEKDKVVLIEKCQNHFDVLPEGWIQVTHNSGMPLYLHKVSRVCTLSKPYFLGPGSVRVRLNNEQIVLTPLDE